MKIIIDFVMEGKSYLLLECIFHLLVCISEGLALCLSVSSQAVAFQGTV